MNKFIRNLVAVGAILTVFSGCSFSAPNPEKDGDKIVKEGLKNFYDVNISSGDGTLTGKIVDKAAKDLSVDLAFSGSGDMRDPENLLLNFKFDGTGMMDGQGENISAEVKVDKSDLYFIVSKLSSFGGLVPADMVKPMLGQWWKTQVPQDMIDSLQDSALVGDDSKLTSEEKKMKNLLKDTQFFSGAKYIGEENGDYHYETVLDKEAIKTFVKESGEIYEEPVSEADLKTLDDNLKGVQLKADFWVGVADKTVHKFKFDFEATDPVAGAKVDGVLTISIGDINKPVIVEPPKDAKEFDPVSLFGGGLKG